MVDQLNKEKSRKTVRQKEKIRKEISKQKNIKGPEIVE